MREEIRVTPTGEILDFAANGGWRTRARAVAQHRELLLAGKNFAALNAPARAGTASPAAAAITGVFRVPTILVGFPDSASAPNLPDGAGAPSRYNELLYAAGAPAGIGYSAPYSLRSYYEELSHGLFSIQGVVAGWVTLSRPEADYTGGDRCAGVNPYGTPFCNGIWGEPLARIAGLMEALALVDGDVDFSQFDNDGPDGIPNSADDDGFVDMVMFIHSERDGSCVSSENPHWWAHRATFFYTTNDMGPHGYVRSNQYTLQGGLGGESGCNPTQLMAVGTAAHETGHALGLPDLYDTFGTSSGIGNWSLMGYGNWTSQTSPSRMDAWSLDQLGWINVQELDTPGEYALEPVATGHTAYLIRGRGANPRGERFLLENRQAVQSDVAVLAHHCAVSALPSGSGCGGGLAVWRVDSASMRNAVYVNWINTLNGPGLSLVQADGRDDLQYGSGRGDAGDLWPGFGTGTPKTRFSFNTNPAASRNRNAGFAGLELDAIRALADGRMQFRLSFGNPMIIAARDTTIPVTVDGTPHNRFEGLFENGSRHEVSIDSATLMAGGRSRLAFRSWSDGGNRTHTVVGRPNADSIFATLVVQHQLEASANGGSVAGPQGGPPAPAFYDGGATIQLRAVEIPGSPFIGWSGDTSTTSNPLVLRMSRPFRVIANFRSPVVIADVEPPAGIMGASYSYSFTATGGTEPLAWTVESGSLPPGLALSPDGVVTGVPAAAGEFPATVHVTSGPATASVLATFRVTEPTLVADDVVNDALGGPARLSADQSRYLDLLGNRNGRFDVGDFLAWARKTGQTPAVSELAARKAEP